MTPATHSGASKWKTKPTWTGNLQHELDEIVTMWQKIAVDYVGPTPEFDSALA
jgi:hypothetical protein